MVLTKKDSIHISNGIYMLSHYQSYPKSRIFCAISSSAFLPQPRVCLSSFFPALSTSPMSHFLLCHIIIEKRLSFILSTIEPDRHERQKKESFCSPLKIRYNGQTHPDNQVGLFVLRFITLALNAFRLSLEFFLLFAEVEFFEAFHFVADLSEAAAVAVC